MKQERLEIELVPDLEHCIETVAKKEYARLQTQLLTGKPINKTQEKKLKVLRQFLETADFKKLRSESEKQLINGNKIRFLVHGEGDVPSYEMQIVDGVDLG